MWSDISPSKGTQRSRRRRGYGTWGRDIYNHNRAEQQDLYRRRGKGTWGSETAKLYRKQRRRERRSKSLLARFLG